MVQFANERGCLTSLDLVLVGIPLQCPTDFRGLALLSSPHHFGTVQHFVPHQMALSSCLESTCDVNPWHCLAIHYYFPNHNTKCCSHTSTSADQLGYLHMSLASIHHCFSNCIAHSLQPVHSMDKVHSNPHQGPSMCPIPSVKSVLVQSCCFW